jgi:hypothetical protein
MNRIRIVPGPEYHGEGISRGLARGLLVYYGDCNLTGEGMGIGSIALRDRECTYFSRSWADSSEAGALRRTFTLDTRMRWAIGGKPSSLLTRCIESCVSAYMQLPRFQKFFLLPVFPVRTLLGIHPIFESVPPRGKVTFTYRVNGSHIRVHAEITLSAGEQDTLCLVNELSAAWFTAGWDGNRVSSPPPGWKKVNPDQLPASLVDPVHGIRFFAGQPSVSLPVPFTLYTGRELNGDHCWAGFCIQVESLDGLAGSAVVEYTVGFARVGGL